MAVINLIAQEKQLRRIAERKVRVAGMSWLLVAVLIGLGWGGLLLHASTILQQQAEVNAQMTKLRPTLQQLQQVQNELNTLRPLVETLRNAHKDTKRWQQLFQHLSQHVPDGCFLTGAELGKRTDPKRPLEITLKGIAQTQQLVGEFMLRLNQHPELEQVRLDYSQERALSEQTTAVEFQITAHIKGTAQPEPKEGQSGGQ